MGILQVFYGLKRWKSLTTESMTKNICAEVKCSSVDARPKVPMCLAGAAHPNKGRTTAVLTHLIRNGEQFVTDVEVFQEILHRNTAILRWDAVDSAFESLDTIAEDTVTYGMSEIRATRALIGSIDGLYARDALHVSVTRKAETNRIFSFDDGFDN